MPTTVNTPLRSDYGFKSPSFNVDLNGNITATTITLTTDSEAGLAADLSFVESAGHFRFSGQNNNEPGFTVFRNQTTTIDISFTTLTFKIFSSVTPTTSVYSNGLRHSDASVGESAQNKSTGRLTWTIPLSAPDTLYYGNVDGTIYGTITVLDQERNFSTVGITSTTQSTSISTGALKVSGGLGVVGNTNVGGTMSVANMISATGGISGDLNGSVYSDNSTLLVDSVNGRIVGPINNSTIDNTSIGATTPSTAAFTTATLTGAVTGVTAVPNKKYVDETSTAFAIAFGI